MEEIHHKESRRLPWLADKLLTDIRAADKIFVHCDREVVDPDRVVPLATTLREIGPATLLSVVANPDRAGTVERRTDAFYVGYVRYLSPTHHAAECDQESWKAILAALPAPAYQVIRNPVELPPTFDPSAYLTHNPDVAAAGANPGEHFLAHGWREGRRWAAMG